MKIRRVVVGRDADKKAIVQSDGSSPREMFLQFTPGFVSSPQWKIVGTPDLNEEGVTDAMDREGSLVPDPGGSVFLIVTFPPDSVMRSGDWEPEIAIPEHQKAFPGISETFESDNPGMHRTPTVDYITVLRGMVVLDLDDGKTVELRQGDTVIQQGVRHAWRNLTDEPATISVVMLGAKT